MKLQGFVNGAYTLDTVEVDAQECVNLYPEVIESGTGKGSQRGYLRNTPGLTSLGTVGDGPIRSVHTDNEGRVFVVSGSDIYRYTPSSERSFEIWTTVLQSGDRIFNGTQASLPTDTITLTSGLAATTSNIYAGYRATYQVSTGSPRGGLVHATEYYIAPASGTTFKVCSTIQNAIDGTGISITSDPTGADFFTSNMSQKQHSINFSQINFNTNEITISDGHGLALGDRVIIGSDGVALPTGLSHMSDNNGGVTYYYPIIVSSTVFKLATSMQNAVDGTAIDLTDPGTTIAKVANATFVDPDGGGVSPNAILATSTGVVKIKSSNPGVDRFSGYTFFTDGNTPYTFYGNSILGADYSVNPAAYGTFEYLLGNRYALADGSANSTFSDSTHVTWIDGYFILAKTGGTNFYTSGFNDITVDELSFAQAEGSPDTIMAIESANRNLYVLGQRSLEIYVNTGNPDFPFERVQSGFIEIGCVAAYSVASISGNVFWVGRGEHGEGQIYMANGTAPRRISTHPIEQELSGYADISTAVAYCYEDKGHFFYVVNFSEMTWTYDISTGVWHKRAYLSSGSLTRHLCDNHTFKWSQSVHIVGHNSSNYIYSLSEAVYTDNGDTIKRIRSTPHISNENTRIFYDELFLDMKTGVGLISGQGSDPQVMLDWSDDGGNTWSDEAWTSAGGQSGGIGEYSTRVRWRRLGSSRDRIFRFSITDPVNVKLIDAYVKVRGANS